MAANPLPQGLDELLALAEDMADGAAAHGVAIGLLQNTEPRIRADIAPLRTAKLNYETAKEDAERRLVRSHPERGNEGMDAEPKPQ